MIYDRPAGWAEEGESEMTGMGFGPNEGNVPRTGEENPRGGGEGPYPAMRGDVLEGLMRRALRSGGFEVYYQPLCNVTDGKFTEAEALLRLRDESGAYVPPEEFIPVAESTGLIVEIGCMVLRKVCLYLKHLLSCRIDVDSISVNLSVVQLMRDDAVPRLLGIIRESGVSPNRILFEVTESILISNYGLIARRIRELSEAGVQFALDDFGTGYSNFSHVIDLPFDAVKIDKSLIWDSMENRKCSIMIRDLTRTFKNMNMTVTAEGVETPEHDRFVRLCGCDRIQGFRYARPMPESRAVDYFGRAAVMQ